MTPSPTDDPTESTRAPEPREATSAQAPEKPEPQAPAAAVAPPILWRRLMLEP